MKMNKSVFFSQIRSVYGILSKYDLCINFCSKYDFERYQLTDVIHIYNNISAKRDYTMELFDNSFIQFSFAKKEGKLELFYYYIPSPFLSYSEYLEKNGLNYKTAGEIFRSDYEIEAQDIIKDNFQAIRYDYSQKEYNKMIHSISHFHIGLNEISISCCKIVTPEVFTMFILKQAYRKEWKKLVIKSDFYKSFCRSKNKCKDISDVYFSNDDKNELYLF